jgi:hypothetical protein
VAKGGSYEASIPLRSRALAYRHDLQIREISNMTTRSEYEEQDERERPVATANHRAGDLRYDDSF